MKKNLFLAAFVLFSVSAFTQTAEPKSNAQLANDNAEISASQKQAEITETQILNEEFADKNESESETLNNSINQNLTVTKINFIGLKKTRNSYIQSRVKKFIGNTLAETDMHELETQIQLEGIFTDINISTEQISDSEAQINISVKEKITFFPVPFAIYTSSSIVAGGVVMDTNAFGQKDMFVLGGFYASTGKTAFASFVKAQRDSRVPGFSVFASGSFSSPEYTNFENDTVLKHDDNCYSLGITVSEKLHENLTISSGFRVNSHENSDVQEFQGLSPESIKSFTISPGISYSKSDWNGIFMSTNSASLSADFGFTNSDNKDFQYPMGFSFAISEQHSIFTPRLRMYQKYSGYYGINNHISAYKGQDAASVSLLSSHFSTEHLIGGNAGLELAIKKFSWGMISLYSDYQILYTQDFNPREPDDDYKFIHGPNGGAKFYLAKIAFPAIALGLTYNVTQDYWKFSAALGMTF
ncbi:POTRA domain-containing protein [uncultured Treponema sp.]|uniref:POTRA domain-containing protein n=1 Tax=uncultured Treponema sp. TaxID=162155 RepID=UPI0025FD1814|nr:POTRA domain-containing protein [uncultured Treponema sp.]